MVHPMRTWIKVCFVVSRSRRFLLQKQMLSSNSWMSPTPFSAAALKKDTNWNTSNPQTSSIPRWSQDMLMWLKAQGMEDEIVFYLLLPLPVLARHPPLGLPQAVISLLCGSAPSPSDSSGQERQPLFPHHGTTSHSSPYTLYHPYFLSV